VFTIFFAVTFYASLVKKKIYIQTFCPQGTMVFNENSPRNRTFVTLIFKRVGKTLCFLFPTQRPMIHLKKQSRVSRRKQNISYAYVLCQCYTRLSVGHVKAARDDSRWQSFQTIKNHKTLSSHTVLQAFGKKNDIGFYVGTTIRQNYLLVRHHSPLQLAAAVLKPFSEKAIDAFVPFGFYYTYTHMYIYITSTNTFMARMFTIPRTRHIISKNCGGDTC